MWRMPTPHHYHLNYQSTIDSLNLCTLEDLVHVRLRVAHHEMPTMMWRTQKLALLLGHFPHNLTNEFSISNIDQVNHPYNFIVHEPGFPLL